MFSQLPWLPVAVVFFGIIGRLAWRRWRERQWIGKHVDTKRIQMISFGAEYFGRQSGSGIPKARKGFLILLPDKLLFRANKNGMERSLFLKRIVRIYPGRDHRGTNLYQSVLKLDYLCDNGEKDAMAFKVPYPRQWIKAIKNSMFPADRP